MKIQIETLKVKNFKGLEDLEIRFAQQTNIFGRNRSGKTTIMDAFLWLLFGKNAEDKKDFPIKNTVKTELNKLDHLVEASFYVDNNILTLSRVYREKWEKKHGNAEESFTGHETVYHINGIPVSMKDYQERVDSLIREDLFKMLTSPTYFNAMKWQDRRAILVNMAGAISREEILKGADFDKFRDLLLTSDIEALKKETAVKIKKLKDELTDLPSRIDEQKRSMPEAMDWKVLKEKKSQYENTIATIEASMLDISKANQAKQQVIKEQIAKQSKLKSRLSEIEFETSRKNEDEVRKHKASINTLKNELHDLRSNIASLRQNITFEQSQTATLNQEVDKLRGEYATEQARQFFFDESACVCPTCKRLLEQGDIDEQRESMLANFNTEKATQLQTIIQKANNRKDRIAEINTTIKKNEETISILQSSLDEKTAQLEALEATTQTIHAIPDEYNKVLAELKAMPELTHEPDGSEKLIADKNLLMQSIDDVNRLLYTEQVIKNTITRIQELDGMKKTINASLAELENIMFSIELYENTYMGIVEKSVNGAFKEVEFRLFNKLINGGIEPACECLVRGVPYSGANTEGKIVGGLDIIQTLNRYYDVYAPVFIDNRESVTYIPTIETQVVSLFVSEADKTLRVVAA